MKKVILLLIFLYFGNTGCAHQNNLVVAVHEHVLKPDVDVNEYEQEVANALQNLKIPGLLNACLLKGFKGYRSGHYAVLWVFENAQAIEDNFGTIENPRWPQAWLYYENEILAKYLTCHPDKINFTDYIVVAQFIKQ